MYIVTLDTISSSSTHIFQARPSMKWPLDSHSETAASSGKSLLTSHFINTALLSILLSLLTHAFLLEFIKSDCGCLFTPSPTPTAQNCRHSEYCGHFVLVHFKTVLPRRVSFMDSIKYLWIQQIFNKHP